MSSPIQNKQIINTESYLDQSARFVGSTAINLTKGIIGSTIASTVVFNTIHIPVTLAVWGARYASLIGPPAVEPGKPPLEESLFYPVNLKSIASFTAASYTVNLLTKKIFDTYLSKTGASELKKLSIDALTRTGANILTYRLLSSFGGINSQNEFVFSLFVNSLPLLMHLLNKIAESLDSPEEIDALPEVEELIKQSTQSAQSAPGR